MTLRTKLSILMIFLVIITAAGVMSGYAVVSVIIVCVLAVMLTGRITGPVLRLMRSAQDIIKNDMGTGCDNCSAGEISGPDGDFDTISQQLRICHARMAERTVAIEQAHQKLNEELEEKERIQRSLKESEQRYAITATGSNDGLWYWNVETGETFFSHRWKNMLGYNDIEIPDSMEEWYKLVHPHDIGRLKAEITGHLINKAGHFECEYRMKAKDGTFKHMVGRGIALRNAEGKVIQAAGSQTDITVRKATEQKLIFDALHDTLTKFPNRALLKDRIGHALMVSKRRKNSSFAVIQLDINRFKMINDSLGHVAGDQLLVELGKKLQECVRETDTLARFGGDDFAILLDDVTGTDRAVAVSERIIENLKKPFTIGDRQVIVSSSIGIVIGNDNYSSAEEILRDVDNAMYQAKKKGQGTYVIFDENMHQSAVSFIQIEVELRQALEKDELVVYYQPVISLAEGHVVGFEALVRWHHPLRGTLYPLDFLHVAEETGFIIDMNYWIIKKACHQMQQWLSEFPDGKLKFISANLSSKQLPHSDLCGAIKAILVETGIPPHCLKLEITENSMIEYTDSSVHTLSMLKHLGVQLYIDDFGTGYSSLSYLHRFPIDAIKIDRFFVNSLDKYGESSKIVSAIVELAHNLNMRVIAEGIETREQLEYFRSLQCEYAQGFHIGRPMTAKDAYDVLVNSGQKLHIV